MAGGITPVSLPMDNLIGKIFEGIYQKHYYLYMLYAPENFKGRPMTTSQ